MCIRDRLPAPPREIDPQVWFEQQGRKVLDDLIYDLNSRGYSSLVIKDNGAILNMLERRSIRQYEDKAVSKETMAEILNAGAWAPSAICLLYTSRCV